MAFLVTLLCLLAVPAQAHRPDYSGGTSFTSMDDAFPIADLEVSIVLYHRVSCESEQLWMRFDATEDDTDLYLQVGVPVVDRLEGYRPSVAVLSPAYSDVPAGLPFEVPEGFGVRLIETGGADVDEFHEPFSDTHSWVVHESTEPVPAGEGYIVSWHPERQTGKLWVATGTVERFGPDDLALWDFWMDETRRFHEVEGYVGPEAPLEEICVDAVVESPVDVPGEVEPSAGCNHSGSASWLGWLMLPVVLRRRA